MKQTTVRTSEAISIHDDSGAGRVGNSDLKCPTTILAAGHEGHEGHVMPPESRPPAVKPGKDKPAAPPTPPVSKPEAKKAGSSPRPERCHRGIRHTPTVGAWRRPASPGI